MKRKNLKTIINILYDFCNNDKDYIGGIPCTGIDCADGIEKCVFYDGCDNEMDTETKERMVTFLERCLKNARKSS